MASCLHDDAHTNSVHSLPTVAQILRDSRWKKLLEKHILLDVRWKNTEN